VRLLLDENLSPRLAERLEKNFPGTRHLDDVGLHGRTDLDIWKFAGEHGYVLASKDNDFRQLSFLYGAPPKVIWLRIGNAPTRDIEALMLANTAHIQRFFDDPETALLIIVP